MQNKMAGRQNVNVDYLKHTLILSNYRGVPPKAHHLETIDQMLTFLRETNILEIGPGDTTEILNFLINDLFFDPI